MIAAVAPDQIGRAVAQAEAGALVPVVQVSIKLVTGRPITLAVPADLTAGEAVDLIGYICTRLPATIEETVRNRSNLVVATGPLPGT